MILPTVNSVPYRTKEVAYGMVTTHSEAILKVMVLTAAGRDCEWDCTEILSGSERDNDACHPDRQLEPDQLLSANAGIPSPEDR